MRSPRGPRHLSRILRRLLPGPLGREACDDIERLHAERRARQGTLLAWLWYAGHLFRPHTWVLAAELRRKAGDSRSLAAVLGASLLDVKLGVRMLGKHPALTVVSGMAMVLSIAIGVGCFSFFQDFFMRPDVPLPGGDRIVSLGLQSTVTGRTERRLLHDFEVWRDELESVTDVGAWREVIRTLVLPDGAVESVRVAEITASGFRVADIPPLLGRPLLDTDEVQGAPPVIVIGYDVWRDRFEGDRNVVGQTLQLGRERHTVVGVMPENFAFPLANDLWVPLRWKAAGSEPLVDSPRAFAFGRLDSGVSREAAQDEMNGVMGRRAAANPETHADLRGLVMHYTDTHTGMEGVNITAVYVVLTFITLILAVPFMNVAILVYARTARRTGEIAVRTALGASRRRIATQLFVEALVLASISAVAGVAIAFYALEQVEAVMAIEAMGIDFGGTAFWSTSGRDPATVGYALGLTVLAAVVAGVVPGLKATGKNVQTSLARAASGNAIRLGGIWTALVVLQVGTTVAFVPPAVALALQATAKGVVEPGFDAGELLSASVARASTADDPTGGEPEVTTSLTDVMATLERDPAVAAVTYSSRVSVNYFEASPAIEVENLPPPERSRGHRAGSLGVGDGFFETLDVRVVSGRTFQRADGAAGATPVVVNQTFVRRVLGDRNALGRRLRTLGSQGEEPGPWREIVGVVADLTLHPLDSDAAQSRIFTMLPPAEELSRATLVLRVPSSPTDFASQVPRIVAGVDPTLRVVGVSPLADSDSLVRSVLRILAAGLAGAVLSVLLLATAGVYALMSFNVTRRRREIGIRTALGAHPRRVLAGIFFRAAGQLALGAAVGVAGAVFLERVVVRSLVVGFEPGGGLLPLLAALMVAVGLAATVGPARQGLRIEPTEALREG